MVLTKWESSFLIMLILPVMGHVIIMPLILDIAGRDAWISVLLSLPLALLYVLLIFHLKRSYPGKDFHQIARLLAGKSIGMILRGFFCLYFMFLSAVSIVQLTDMINIGFLPETPNSILVIWFMIFCVYAAKIGIKGIALASGLLLIFAIAIGYLVSFASAPMKDWNNLNPILEFGWHPVFLGTLVILSVWAELAFLLMIPMNDNGEKHLLRNWIGCILWNALIMIAAMTGTVMIFGLGEASNFLYPNLEVVRIISLGFIDRFDTYALVLMSFGCFIRTSLYLRLGCNLLLPARSGNSGNIGLYVLSGMVMAGCLCIAGDHFRVQHFSRFNIYGVMIIPLIFGLNFLSWIKKKRSRQM